MATKELLSRLSFRSLKTTLQGVTKISVRYGDMVTCSGHTAAR